MGNPNATNQERWDAALKAMETIFAAEELFPLGNGLRKNLFEARKAVDNVRWQLRTAILEEQDAERNK